MNITFFAWVAEIWPANYGMVRLKVFTDPQSRDDLLNLNCREEQVSTVRVGDGIGVTTELSLALLGAMARSGNCNCRASHVQIIDSET